MSQNMACKSDKSGIMLKFLLGLLVLLIMLVIVEEYTGTALGVSIVYVQWVLLGGLIVSGFLYVMYKNRMRN